VVAEGDVAASGTVTSWLSSLNISACRACDMGKISNHTLHTNIHSKRFECYVEAYFSLIALISLEEGDALLHPKKDNLANLKFMISRCALPACI
jgi:hypothetical protein